MRVSRTPTRPLTGNSMKRKEFEKFLRTEAFTCPNCKRKDIRFASEEDAKAAEIPSPVSLRCSVCQHEWGYSFPEEHVWKHVAPEKGHGKPRKK